MPGQKNMPAMLELYLIRHGETLFNKEERIQGTLDSPLSEKGTQQCQAAGRALSRKIGAKKIDEWLVSPQGRARQSSALIRSSLDGLPEETIEPDLREIDCGEAEGKIRTDLPAELLQSLHLDPHQRYPGGESVADLVERGRILRERLFQLPEQGQIRKVVVSHGNFIRALAAALIGMSPEFAIRISMGNTGICRLVLRPGDEHFKIMQWNDLSHLI